MMYVLGFFFVIVIATCLVGYLLSAPGYDGPKSDHFDGKRFINPNDLAAQNFIGVMKYGLFRKPEKWIENYETDVRKEPIKIPLSDDVQITFINHSSFLIQVGGLNIVTDPIWSLRCSPFQWVGPKRMRPPGVSMDLIPKVDIVLLTHNHYDHLDIDSVIAISKRDDPQFVVPLGLSKFLNNNGVTNTVELDWAQEKIFDELTVKSMPANHFSARGLFDRDKTLWCGYMIKLGEFKMYFVGDTGYGPNFKQVGEEEESIDLALIPIGAYLPKWFMSPIHISPDEAVQVHKDIKAKHSIAMHFGTFPLADDAPLTSQRELRRALKENGIDDTEFIIPDEGNSYQFKIT